MKKLLSFVLVFSVLLSACSGANSSTPNTDGTAAQNSQIQSSDWEITWYDGSDKDRGDGTTFRDMAEKLSFRAVDPYLWQTFPNVPNPLVNDFRVVNGTEVPDGLEYAMAETNFCQQNAGETCRFPVAPWHYHSFTGDYKWLQFSGEEAGTNIGQNLIIVNVGDVSSDFTAMFGQGFRLHARYWNGEKLDMAMWGLASYNANVMLDLKSALNPDKLPKSANAGGNCSSPRGCKGVDITIVFVSGNELLMSLHTVVKK